jgi:hypothetical protein
MTKQICAISASSWFYYKEKYKIYLEIVEKFEVSQKHNPMLVT